jgi:hypothetical protein
LDAVWTRISARCGGTMQQWNKIFHTYDMVCYSLRASIFQGHPLECQCSTVHMPGNTLMRYALPNQSPRFEILEKFRSKFRFRAIFRDFWFRSRRNHFFRYRFLLDFLIKETEMRHRCDIDAT